MKYPPAIDQSCRCPSRVSLNQLILPSYVAQKRGTENTREILARVGEQPLHTRLLTGMRLLLVLSPSRKTVPSTRELYLRYLQGLLVDDLS